MAELPYECFAQGLDTLSVCRADLPYNLLSGTEGERLVQARDLARKALLKYTRSLEMDYEQADWVLFQIDQWSKQNQVELQSLIGNTQYDTLPEQIQLKLGPEQAQNFLIAAYVIAARGIGPWTSGAVRELISAGKLIERDMDLDYTDRIQTFLAIVKMEQQGDLQTIFVLPPPQPVEQTGLGFVQALGPAAGKIIVWAIVVTLCVSAALLLVYAYSSARLRHSNRVMDDICRWAMENNRQDVVQACLNAAKEARAENPMVEMIKMLGFTVVGAAALVWGLPAMIGEFKKMKSKRAARWAASE